MHGAPQHERSPAANSSGRRHERTVKKRFSPGSNPHDLIRCAQKEKCVWYAAYDEEMLAGCFAQLLKLCNDQTAPIVLFSVYV